MTCRDTNYLVKDLGITIVETNTVVITSIDLGTGLIAGKVFPEPGHLASKEGITLTLDTTMMMKQETLPGGKKKMKKETMTLAMGNTIEGAARRPCFMGGPL